MLDTPQWKQQIASRLAGLNLPPEREAEIIEELDRHMADEFRRLLAAGATEAEAADMVLEGLNGRPPIAEGVRGVEPPAPRHAVALGGPRKSVAGDLWRDLLYAWRTMWPVRTLLVAVGLLAGYVPARQAAGVDPLTALRAE